MTETQALDKTRSVLLAALPKVEALATTMEEQLITETDMANSRAYGRICRVLGILEEEIEIINDEITNL